MGAPSNFICLKRAARRAAARTRPQAGFTIIEVMVAMLVLIIGVLGTVALIDRANAKTVTTKQREAGTNLARELIETARGVRYSSLTPAAIVASLQAKPGLADAQPGGPWTIERRGFTYTVEEASVCMIDDPGDGTANTSTAGGFCSNGAAGASPDPDPEDLKRVLVRVSYQLPGNAAQQVRQTTIIHPGQAGPRITSLTETARAATSITFSAAFGPAPASVEWHVQGVAQGRCPLPCGTNPWSFTWNITTVPDGVYVLNVQAYDPSGRSAGPQAVTIRLNRTVPAAPALVGGGWNNVDGVPFGGNPFVEIEWVPSPEPDVAGYRVYRGGSIGADGKLVSGSGTLVNCTATDIATGCADTGAFAAAPGGTRALTYHIVALDRDDNGALREGFPRVVPVVWPNMRPFPPTNLVAVRAGNTTTLTWTKARGKIDPDKDDILFYRVYRDGLTFATRVSRETDFNWVDANNGGAVHTYRVTAVDDNLTESTVAEVTK